MGVVLHCCVQVCYVWLSWAKPLLTTSLAAAKNSFYAFDDKEPALPSVVFYTSANRELPQPSGSLPFPALKQLLHWFERPQISPKRKSIFFLQEKIWSGGWGEATAGTLQHHGFEGRVWSRQSHHSREQGSALTHLGRRWRLHIGNFNSLWTIVQIFWIVGMSWNALSAESTFQVCLWQVSTLWYGGLLVTINLLLEFFSQNMDSCGTGVTHFLLLFAWSSCSKNSSCFKNNDCFIIAVFAPSAQPLLFEALLRLIKDPQHFQGEQQCMSAWVFPAAERSLWF